MTDTPTPAVTDALIEWRENIGVRIMLAMVCKHDGDDFGPRAVCTTCFDNTQRVGAIVQDMAAHAWDQGRMAERRDWELMADLVTPDEGRQPWPNPYRATLAARAHIGEAVELEKEDRI